MVECCARLCKLDFAPEALGARDMVEFHELEGKFIEVEFAGESTDADAVDQSRRTESRWWIAYVDEQVGNERRIGNLYLELNNKQMQHKKVGWCVRAPEDDPIFEGLPRAGPQPKPLGWGSSSEASVSDVD